MHHNLILIPVMGLGLLTLCMGLAIAQIVPSRYSKCQGCRQASIRAVYVWQVAQALKLGGYVIVATFGPQGPQKCSGLDVVGYHADSLHEEFGASVRLIDSYSSARAVCRARPAMPHMPITGMMPTL